MCPFVTVYRGNTEAKTLEYSNFSLNVFALEAVANFETIANQNAIDIQILAEDEILYWGDRFRIRQLWDILVDNAVKYMGRRPGSIQISMFEMEKMMHTCVLNTGRGIDPVYLTKIFNRFYRGRK